MIYYCVNTLLYNINKMKQTKGYIYIRKHPSYDVHNACKIGKTINIPERDVQYATGEIERGYFETVFEVPVEKLGFVERLLHYEFRELNVRHNAGTEFYNKKIITLIEPYLKTIRIKYRKLSEQEISDLTRCNRVREIIKKINIHSLIHILKSSRTNKQIISYVPRNYQNVIVEKSVIYFQQYDKGMLILTCGVGKTLISLWITQKLNSNTILIGVPSITLLEHWQKVICILFQNIPCLTVSGNIKNKEIKEYLEKNQKKCIVITMFLSSWKVLAVTQETNFVFDMKILDEVHHLTKNNIKVEDDTKEYIKTLNISSVKQLSLTATPKEIENICNDDFIVSNDNVEHFGEIIDRKSLLWGINENIICDYVIQTIVTNEEELEQQLLRFHIIEENDKRLFLSAFASLKSIFERHSHHLLIYSNNRNNSFKIISYIKLLLEDKYFDIPDLYYSNYNGEMNLKDRKNIENNFNNAKFGIITCVYCLGEGYDNYNIDGVVFAENMTSEIRIFQSALRGNRKNKYEPNKIAKIILPFLNKDDLTEENKDFKKIKEVIFRMGLEDQTITQKIKAFKIDIVKQKQNKKEKKEMVNEFGEYDEKLIENLLLKTIKRPAIGITYEKARKIIADKNIKSKKSYYELCERDNRLFKEPEIVFKGQFTNWIEYLSIERIYYNLETCKNKVGEYLSNETNIDFEFTNITKSLKILDNMFPPYDLWGEYYDINDLTEIIKHNKNEELVEF